MRILIYSRAFLPHVGGLEYNVAHLASLLVKRGHEVVVATVTPGEGRETLPFPVLRDPGPLELLRWVRWCEVFHQANVSLRGFWPLLLVRRPWVVSHHGWYCRPDGRIAWQDRLKRLLLRYAAGSISISSAVAADLPAPSVVIGNAYRESVFRELAGVERSRDLLFVGRLVSDKGVDILLDALKLLESRGLTPHLTIAGEGPERPLLDARAEQLGLSARLHFLGTRTGDELVRIFNEHRILVVPSRYNEPFGIVALEGIACGCVVVGSEGGGLKDAIGPCGRTFANRDAGALAAVLADLLSDPASHEQYRRLASRHLAEHTGEYVVDKYLEVFQASLRGK